MTTIIDNNGASRDSSAGVLTGILVVVVILLIAWAAYANGWFRAGAAAPAANTSNLHIDVGGSTGGGTSGGTTGGAAAPSGATQ